MPFGPGEEFILSIKIPSQKHQLALKEFVLLDVDFERSLLQSSQHAGQKMMAFFWTFQVYDYVVDIHIAKLYQKWTLYSIRYFLELVG